MRTWYLVLVAFAGLLILLPALVAGAGFVVAGVFILLLVLVALVGPKGFKMWWDQHLTRAQGENAGMQLRDVIGGHNQRPGQDDSHGPTDRWGDR